jgi:hypothetical protein
VELIENGEVSRSFPRTSQAGEISLSIKHAIKETSWFALRGYGNKVKERMLVQPWHFKTLKPMSTVHSAPIYVTIKNAPPSTAHPRTKTIARTWLARLQDVETMLNEDNIEYFAQKIAYPGIDGVPKETLLKNRLALLKEIQDAKDYFERLSH